MRKLLIFLSIVLIGLPVSAQAPKPKVVAKPGDKPTTEAPKRGVLGRIFGRKQEPAPVPAPTPPAATPAPKTKKYRPKKPIPAVQKPDDRGEEVEPAENTKPKPAEPEVKPAAGNKKSGKKNTPPPPTPADVDEKTKYNAARDKAEEDAAIKELKSKADGALTDSEVHSTSVAYNRALYRKIREIDPSLETYVNRLEEVMMKRLNSENKGE